MTISPAVIEALQASVRLHWQAIHVYTLQASHFSRWGYSKLAAAAKADVAEEQEHLERLTKRLELADVEPACVAEGVCAFARHDFVKQLALNLELEMAAAAVERAGILTAREEGDEGTAEVFEENLKGSEDSILEIESTQKVISQVGIDNYLANQI